MGISFCLLFRVVHLRKKLHNNHTHLQQNSFFFLKTSFTRSTGHYADDVLFDELYNGGWVALNF